MAQAPLIPSTKYSPGLLEPQMPEFPSGYPGFPNLWSEGLKVDGHLWDPCPPLVEERALGVESKDGVVISYFHPLA